MAISPSLAPLRAGSGIILLEGVLATLVATLGREIVRPFAHHPPDGVKQKASHEPLLDHAKPNILVHDLYISVRIVFNERVSDMSN
jgi:hypothetical protein